MNNIQPLRRFRSVWYMMMLYHGVSFKVTTILRHVRRTSCPVKQCHIIKTCTFIETAVTLLHLVWLHLVCILLSLHYCTPSSVTQLCHLGGDGKLCHFCLSCRAAVKYSETWSLLTWWGSKFMYLVLLHVLKSLCVSFFTFLLQTWRFHLWRMCVDRWCMMR